MDTNTYSALWFQLYMPLQTEEWTAKDVAFLTHQLPLPRYARVLDLCCGYGRHALLLAQHGYQVSGLDRNEAAISEAKRRARKAKQIITYLVGDMRQVGEMAGEFDAVISMWQSFGYFDAQTNRTLLCDIARKLTPHGRLILDLYHRDYFEKHQESRCQEINGITVTSHGYMQGTRWHSVLHYSDAHGARGSDHMEWQLFTPAEFGILAAQCGFVMVLACTWSDESREPSADVARMQLVLEKR